MDAILHWSWWRRVHEGCARYYHARRRATSVCEQPAAEAGARVERPAADTESDQLERMWQRLRPHLAQPSAQGRPYAHDRRLVLEVIVYRMHTNGGWRQLPARFPPWKTVYSQLTAWRVAGIWDAIWAEERLPDSELQL